MKVLVLDDHQAFREEVLAMLSRGGHEGVGADSAQAAIPLVRDGTFDFVLVDYSMPEHDGIWFLRQAKLPRHTKALLVTAHVNTPMIAQALNLGAVGYLIKPFDEADLLRHLAFHSSSADAGASAGSDWRLDHHGKRIQA